VCSFSSGLLKKVPDANRDIDPALAKNDPFSPLGQSAYSIFNAG
jgi:hypothetical protein